MSRQLMTAALMAGLCLALAGHGKDGPGDEEVVAWVAKTVQERQPPKEDKRFDEIGWVTDIRQAIQLGKKHQRPIFLFTMDGRINTGRC